jgi:hypothetical protein
MREEYVTWRGAFKCIQSFGGKNLMEIDNMKDDGLEGRILKEISKE